MSGPGYVVVAVYRPKIDLLRRQLDSIAAQSLRDWRCLIGIDGADAETLATVAALVEGDDRFDVVEYATNVGVYRHIERMLRTVPADVNWVALSDQDDYFYPDKFATLTAELDRAHATAVIGQARVIDQHGTELSVTDRHAGSLDDLLLFNQLTGGASILRRDVLDAALPFPPGSSRAAHDHWLAVVAAARGPVVASTEVVQDYVQHGDNLIGEGGPGGVGARLATVRSGGIRAWLDRELGAIWQWRRDMAAQLITNLGPRLTTIPCAAPTVSRREKVRAIIASVRTRHVSLVEGIALVAAGAVSASSRGRAPSGPDGSPDSRERTA